jgi:hypothetical protein
MAKPVDGVGLAALALGSALMWAGVKGYSFLAVLENLVTGKPIHTDVKITQKLVNFVPVTGAVSGAISGGTTPEGESDSHG